MLVGYRGSLHAGAASAAFSWIRWVPTGSGVVRERLQGHVLCRPTGSWRGCSNRGAFCVLVMNSWTLKSDGQWSDPARSHIQDVLRHGLSMAGTTAVLHSNQANHRRYITNNSSSSMSACTVGAEVVWDASLTVVCLQVPAWQSWLLQMAVELRTRFLHQPYGDQALFVRRDTLRDLNVSAGCCCELLLCFMPQTATPGTRHTAQIASQHNFNCEWPAWLHLCA